MAICIERSVKKKSETIACRTQYYNFSGTFSYTKTIYTNQARMLFSKHVTTVKNLQNRKAYYKEVKRITGKENYYMNEERLTDENGILVVGEEGIGLWEGHFAVTAKDDKKHRT